MDLPREAHQSLQKSARHKGQQLHKLQRLHLDLAHHRQPL
jgi:hypothetical protein